MCNPAQREKGMSTLTIRVPPVLKAAIERKAKAANLSVNIYVQRLLERETIQGQKLSREDNPVPR